MSREPSHTDAPEGGAVRTPAAPTRVFAGGVFMGLANLVPGVSGGTMILALGLYDRFIGAVADIARLRLDARSLGFLVVLLTGAAVAVLGLATPAVWVVQEHRWLAYSLFIGMTLGGVPLLWGVVRPLDLRAAAGVLAGFGGMAVVAFGLQSTALSPTIPTLVLAGALAGSSMILPGISGSYILLILGLYDTIVGSVRPATLRAEPAASIVIIVAVGVGVVVGVGLLSNGLRWLLARHTRVSHAVLLGLLVGSVLGLWPFQRPAAPGPVAGAAEIVRLERYRPTAGQAGIALVALASGLALTVALGRLGNGGGNGGAPTGADARARRG